MLSTKGKSAIGVRNALVMTFGLGLLTGGVLFAQDNPRAAGWKFGSEIDVLPYAMGGYYASGFAGHEGWRFRGVVARSTTPSFLVTDGFEEKRTDAYALLTDRFVGPGRNAFQGFWVGGGAEYWRNRIRAKGSSDFVYYQNYMMTGGGGYVWKLSRHVYLNPWVGGHVVGANSREILVSGKVYKQPLFTPEGSVKIGFIF